MIDELECFRKAAGLGCPDLKSVPAIGKLFLIAPGTPEPTKATGQVLFTLPNQDERINRYAAAVCAEWWLSQCHKPEFNGHGFVLSQEKNNFNYFVHEMIEVARAFGKKYGA